MLRVVLVAVMIVLLARAFWRIVDGVIEGLSGPLRPRARSRGVQMARDPVCGTYVLPDRAVTMTDGPRLIHFCSTACRDRYRTHPECRAGRGGPVEGRTA